MLTLTTISVSVVVHGITVTPLMAWYENYSDAAEVVIDDEHGVILEWNDVVDGQVFERSAFTSIDFKIALTARDSDPVALGLTKLWI